MEYHRPWWRVRSAQPLNAWPWYFMHLPDPRDGTCSQLADQRGRAVAPSSGRFAYLSMRASFQLPRQADESSSCSQHTVADISAGHYSIGVQKYNQRFLSTSLAAGWTKNGVDNPIAKTQAGAHVFSAPAGARTMARMRGTRTLTPMVRERWRYRPVNHREQNATRRC